MNRITMIRLKAQAVHRFSINTTTKMPKWGMIQSLGLACRYRSAIHSFGVGNQWQQSVSLLREAEEEDYKRIKPPPSPCSITRRRWSCLSATIPKTAARDIPLHNESFRVSIASPSSSTATSYSSQRRKHFWDRNKLSRMTNDIIALLVAMDDANSENNPKNETRPDLQSTSQTLKARRNHLNINHCFDILEAWMEFSKEEGQRIREQRGRRGRGGGLDSAHHARRLLYAMERSASNSDSGTTDRPFNAVALELKVSFYNVVLQAYAVSGGKREAAETAQALLKHMIDQCRSHIIQEEKCQSSNSGGTNHQVQRIGRPVEPNNKTYNIVINCWAKSEEKDAGFKAQEIVDLMSEWMEECSSRRRCQSSSLSYYRGSHPNEVTIVSTIDAWSRSGHPFAPEKAMELWNEGIKLRMEQQHQRRQQSFPAVSSFVGAGPILFNATIGVWVRSGRGREGMIQAEEILRHMIRLHEMGVSSSANNNKNVTSVWPLPDNRSYNIIFSGWADCEKSLQGTRPGEGAERAEQVLLKLLRLFRETDGQGVKPNRHFFTSCIAAWARAAGQGVAEAPERAQQLFDKLVAMYEESECCDTDLMPDIELSNAAITAWARALHRPDFVVKAQEVVNQLRKFSKPDLVTYNIILDGMGKRGMGKEAIKLLEWLEKESSPSNDADGRRDAHRLLRPDDTSYNNVLMALAMESGGDSPKRVLAMLDRMDQLASSPERSHIRPSIVSCTIALTAWERKRRGGIHHKSTITIDDVEQANMLVQKLISRYTNEGDISCRPDARVFTTLIQICSNLQQTATGDERKRALAIVLDAITAVEEIAMMTTITTSPSSSDGKRSSSSPNLYMTMFYEESLLALSRLCASNPAQKSYLMQTYFDTCAKNGYVSNKVAQYMRALDNAVAVRYRREREGHGGGGEQTSTILKVLRPEWSRNVPARIRPRINARKLGQQEDQAHDISK